MFFCVLCFESEVGGSFDSFDRSRENEEGLAVASPVDELEARSCWDRPLCSVATGIDSQAQNPQTSYHRNSLGGMIESNLVEAAVRIQLGDRWSDDLPRTGGSGWLSAE